MAPQNHALLAPSASSRWLRCPASVIWTSRAPRGESSAFAREGTWAHALAERYLRAGIDGTPDSEVRFTDEEVTAIVAAGLDPDDFVPPVLEYVNYVRCIPGMLLVEQELDLEQITGEKGAKGTSDAVVIDDSGELHIIDLKYGRGEQVEADHNSQLAIYAGAALAAFGFMADLKIVNLHIVQPRLDHAVVWTAPLDVFEPFLEDIRKGAAKATELPQRASITPDRWPAGGAASGGSAELWQGTLSRPLALSSPTLSSRRLMGKRLRTFWPAWT